MGHGLSTESSRYCADCLVCTVFKDHKARQLCEKQELKEFIYIKKQTFEECKTF
jgi:hypothetical protein